MKLKTLNQIQGVLVTANRTDLAEALAGIVPGVQDGTGPHGRGFGPGKGKGCETDPEVVFNKDTDYDEYFKGKLKGFGKTLKDVKSLSPEEWQSIDKDYAAKNETD